MLATRWSSIAILITGAVFTVWTSLGEAPFVAELYRQPWTEFRDFMANSYFEGRPFGGSDIGVSLAILSFLLWLRSRQSKSSTRPPRHLLLFLWLSSLITGLAVVHSLKLLISRARPKIVITENLSFDAISSLTWPGFLTWDGPRGPEFNSFPSGHTASCAIMLGYVYLLWPRQKLWALFTFITVLAFSGSMAIARSMAGMHWLSDSVASFFLAWFVIDTTARTLKIHQINKLNQKN